jgi:hypothetical protein
MIVPRIAVSDVPADGGCVPHERIGDHGRGVEEDRVALPDGWRGIEVRLACQRADMERAVMLGDVAKPRDPVDVDDERRLGEAEFEHRDQALTAGEDLGVLVIVEQGDCVVESGGSDVVEGRGNHAHLLGCTGRARLWGTGLGPPPTLESLAAGHLSMSDFLTAVPSARSSIG